MSLRDCLNSAVAQGAINQRQADELNTYYEARFRKKRPGMSERDAMKATRDEVAAELRAEAKLKRRNALLMEAKRKELSDYIKNHVTLYGNQNMVDAALSKMIHYGYRGTGSMKQREDGILALAHRDLAEAMVHFRRTAVLGRGRNKADLVDVVKEINGEATGNATAKAFGRAFSNVIEEMRQRFNKAGGNIPKREGYDIPHTHNARKMLALAKTPDDARLKWKAFIQPLIDPNRMINPRTGETVGEAGIDEALDYAFESIVSDGWAHRRPESRKFGMGAIATRHAERRFLEFRDASAWLRYNDAFGEGDVITALFGHVKTMAKDIAALETFGPNPDAMIEYIKQAIKVQLGRDQAGLSSKLKRIPGMDAGKRADYRIDSLWRALRGQETVWSAPAQYADDVRNVATAAMLGATGQLAALTDPVISAASRALAGMPITFSMHKLVRSMASDADRLAATRRAILWDDYLHTLNEEARFVDQMIGHEWSRYLVDRAMTANALKPLTNARKRVEAGAWHETLGGYAKKDTDWLDLPPLLKKTFEGFGFSDRDWHKMRGGVDEIGFLDPGGVLERTGDRDLAERYAGMISQWGERAVPSGDPRIKSVVTGMLPRGSIMGEIAQFGTMFLSFGMSFTARQIEAIYIMAMTGSSRSRRVINGATYSVALALPLTLGAAMYRQVKAIEDGKDPEDMTEQSFWAQSFIQGGGGGIFADFVARSESRFGQSFAETLPGPGVALVSDTLDLTFGTVKQLISGEESNPGRKLSNYIGRYTPVVSSHPLTRLWWRRNFVDQLQWATDPNADASFKARKSRTSYYWEPGEAGPSRGPDLSTALGSAP